MSSFQGDKYIRAYTKQLLKGETSEVRRLKRFYQTEYNKGVEVFLLSGKTNNFIDLFKKNDYDKIYESIYVNIGLRFANWYADNITRFIKKELDKNDFKDTWERQFASEGERIAAVRVVTVQGTAKKELEKTLQRLMTDVDFQSRGAVEKGRILRQRFNKLGTYQAERIVRTEATNAANFGVMQSATDIYGKSNLQKEWISALDARVRDGHRTSGGIFENSNEPSIVNFNDKFIVNGERLDRAGDPAGSPSNVINCRCAIAPFPKPDADTITPLNQIAVGVAQSQLIKPILNEN